MLPIWGFPEGLGRIGVLHILRCGTGVGAPHRRISLATLPGYAGAPGTEGALGVGADGALGAAPVGAAFCWNSSPGVQSRLPADSVPTGPPPIWAPHSAHTVTPIKFSCPQLGQTGLAMSTVGGLKHIFWSSLSVFLLIMHARTGARSRRSTTRKRPCCARSFRRSRPC